MSKKITNDALRADWTRAVGEWLKEIGKDVLRCGKARR